MRELAAELVPAVFEGSYPYRVSGLFTGSPPSVYVPKKDDLLRVMSNSWRNLRITDEDHDLVVNSKVFSLVKDNPYYTTRLAKNPGSVYDFLKIFRWGGDELVEALMVEREYLAPTVHEGNHLVELLASDWRLDVPMDAHELSLLIASTDGYLFSVESRQEDPFTAEELLSIFLSDRAALPSGYRNYYQNRRYSNASWFYHAVSDAIEAFRCMGGSRSSLELLMILEREDWFDHESGNIRHEKVAEVAHQMVLG